MKYENKSDIWRENLRFIKTLKVQPKRNPSSFGARFLQKLRKKFIKKS